MDNQRSETLCSVCHQALFAKARRAGLTVCACVVCGRLTQEEHLAKNLDAAEAQGREAAIEDCIAALEAKAKEINKSAGGYDQIAMGEMIQVVLDMLDDTPAGEGSPTHEHR